MFWYHLEAFWGIFDQFWNSTEFSVLFSEKLRIRENSRILGAGNSSDCHCTALHWTVYWTVHSTQHTVHVETCAESEVPALVLALTRNLVEGLYKRDCRRSVECRFRSRLDDSRRLTVAVPPISSGFPELAAETEHLEFRSHICSVFLWFALENSVFYSLILANVILTHAKSLTTVKFQGFKRQSINLEGNTLL